MNLIDIRRIFTQVEDIFHEGGPRAAQPLRRGAIAAVLGNPYAGRSQARIVRWTIHVRARPLGGSPDVPVGRGADICPGGWTRSCG